MNSTTGTDQHFESLSRREWIETDGLGGFASGTISGAATRRYHGLLVAALRPPVERMMLVSALDATIHAGDGVHELGCHRYPGAIHPQGHRLVESFRRDVFPGWTYRAGSSRVVKQICAVHGQSVTIVSYTLDDADGDVELELRPFLTWRDIHALGPATWLSESVVEEAAALRYRPVAEAPEVFLSAPGAGFHARPEWYRRFQLDRERDRGFDHEEDLFTPGTLRLGLRRGETIHVVIAAGALPSEPGARLVESERRRRSSLVESSGARSELAGRLVLAADQFVVRRGDDERSIIAGYPWFTDWGRDAMIALPGLCLTTKRIDDARSVLRAFAHHVDCGMLPNRFPDRGEQAEYNTVDATLWFFLAIHAYVEAVGFDVCVRDELLPVLREILAWHDRGTRYGIVVDGDGLLRAGEPGVQLTWMDARARGVEVTPRHGKPVEIQALFVNALRILARFEREVDDAATAEALDERATRAATRFRELFWDASRGHLADVVEDDGVDETLRPNQLLALSLPFPLLEGEEARTVLRRVVSRLAVPGAVRSLDPDDPRYRPHYAGGPDERDAAYHQGTAWGWLVGPLVSALLRHGDDELKARARSIVVEAAARLDEFGCGTLAEIFDAELPFTPRGAFAQAWSVAELLRVFVDELGERTGSS